MLASINISVKNRTIHYFIKKTYKVKNMSKKLEGKKCPKFKAECTSE